MSSRKAIFYIDDEHRSIVSGYQNKNGLASPSAAIRKIIEAFDAHPAINESELELLAEVLKDNTQRAKGAIAEAFNEIESTKKYLRGLEA